MIPKANLYTVAAAAALAVTLTAGRPAVAETLLDVYTVKDMGIVQVNDAGQCVVIVTVNSGAAGADEVRVVGDAKGAAKLYTNFGAADSIIKSSKIEAGTEFKIIRKLKAASIGNPVNVLIASHKAAVKEAANFTETEASIEGQIVAGAALGWDTSVNTPERAEYDQYLIAKASVTEVKTKAAARVVTLAASLTAAGINPVTYDKIV